MKVIKTDYNKTGYFSKTMTDYLSQNKEITSFYNRFPTIENFKLQIEEKQSNYSLKNRLTLVGALRGQYESFSITGDVEDNLSLLEKENTFTITTGHQLNLFTGPAYFLYKIVSVLNLCKDLKREYPDCNFVPIYWMASEDHDFEEIQYFNFKGTKNSWNRATEGAVGRMSTEGLDAVFNTFSSQLNLGENAKELRSLFDEAYLKHDNLSDATRYLVNYLFGEQGLIIVDGDDIALKELFLPHAQRELQEEVTFKHVSATNETLVAKGYKVQVNPREINLFYLGTKSRERIVKQDAVYITNDSKKQLNIDTLPAAVISPNALLRPLYQEVILPNLCYVGGGGELAYWLQLKDTFKAFNVTFPSLLLRNSVLIADEKSYTKAQKLNINFEDLFLKQSDLINKKVKEISNIDFNFQERRQIIQQNFDELSQLAQETDASFVGAVKAQEVKQLKGLDNLEKRLLKAEKKRLNDVLSRLEDLQNSLFPKLSLQERQNNFSEFYEAYGQELINTLLQELKPLEQKFTTLVF